MAVAEVVIAGGGLIGCAVARLLALDGFRVCLYERGRIGREASGAAAGMLGVQAEESDELLLRLGWESRRHYPQWLDALRAETGMSVEFWTEGTLYVAYDATEAARLQARSAWQARIGLHSQPIDADSARRLEPALGTRIHSAVLFPHDGRVDNGALTEACARAARRAGCTIVEGVAVEQVAVTGGRVCGVRTQAGRVACDLFVDAAGAWAPALSPGAPLPVRPVRGQIVCLQADRPPFRRTVCSARGYAVGRRDGRLLLGSTHEDAGFDKSVTAAGVAGILGAALELAPGLGGLPVTAVHAGLRPASADRRPFIGRDPSVEGLFVATGHGGDGILLAPLTAELLRKAVRGEEDARLPLLAPGRAAAAPR